VTELVESGEQVVAAGGSQAGSRHAELLPLHSLTLRHLIV
jgi:hypothetical protein